MTIGVGGFNTNQALAELTNMTAQAKPISKSEYRQRIKKAQSLMQQHQISATFIYAGTNLQYFTGTQWYPSERLVAAILPAQGDIEYIVPHFEIDTFQSFSLIAGKINTWHEDEDPYQLVNQCLLKLTDSPGQIAVDETTPFFVVSGLQTASEQYQWITAEQVIKACRMQKSVNELALMQCAKNMTLAVHKATARILKPGITTQQVTEFIDQAHQKVGAKGSSFCIVLFGKDSAFPHGVKSPKALADNEIVLIDTGCIVEGYQSDITRTYVFGEPNTRQREIWNIEKQAQLAAFKAAKIGTECGKVDVAARQYLASQGLGPDYDVPGLPHRTGHGIGLDIHESPYLVANDTTPLANGMCFSNEPMIVLPGEFGVRLEDHFYMTEQGPKWFTEPAFSIDDPFGYQA